MSEYQIYQPTDFFTREAVTEEQRQQAGAWLRAAYIDGTLTPGEYDARVSAVYAATTRVELDAAFAGIKAATISPAAGTATRPMPARGSEMTAAIAHWSALVTWVFGPLVIRACSTPGSYTRQQASRAVNVQLIFGALFMAAWIMSGILGFHHLDDLVGLAWLASIVYGGIQAKRGKDWTNPLVARSGVRIVAEN